MTKPYIIGITGGSGSGKTSFIKAIRKAFTREELCIISQDDYYFPIDQQLKDEAGVENFDLPTSIDGEQFIKDIKQLIAGNTVKKTEHTFNNVDLIPKTLVFEPAPIIVVEGIFVFHYPAIKDLLDLKIFIDAKSELKLIRRINRDQIERGYPLKDILHQCQHHVLPAFEKYILPYKEEADLVINNNDNFDGAFDVVKGFITQKLKI